MVDAAVAVETMFGGIAAGHGRLWGRGIGVAGKLRRGEFSGGFRGGVHSGVSGGVNDRVGVRIHEALLQERDGMGAGRS